MTQDEYADHHGCEATWVVNGQDTTCDQPATKLVRFDDDALLVCRQCASDLADFDLYHTERQLAGELAALQSWTGKPS